MLDRNQESRFALNPTNLDLPRSKFGTSHRLLTSFNVGELIPILCKEIYPGDTMQLDTSKVVRLQTPITPFFDNLYLDTYYFFVPNRLVWDHWRELMGENTESAWYPTTEYSVPQLVAPPTGMLEGTLWDYFGLPTKVPDLSVSALPFRAYALICNDWFRTEALSDPLLIPKSDANQAGANGGADIVAVANGGKPYKVSRYRDYFSSCLPSPQAGPDVAIPVANVGDLPVVSKSEIVPLQNFPLYGSSSQMRVPLYLRSTTNDTTMSNHGYQYMYRTGAATQQGTYSSANDAPTTGVNATAYVTPVNLWALNPSAASAASINELRTAFQIQRWYEKSARSGQRYIEAIKAFFGVTSPDARMQRPEYLGGNRVSLNVMQVNQTSGTGTALTPLGTPGAMSMTSDTHSDFTHSFVEHGYVIGVCCVRRDHTYQQGIERHWSRKDKFDYYWPTFAHLGEQAVLNKELFADGTSGDDEVFGYQEAWGDLRYGTSLVTGEMRSNAQQSLDVWHCADDYASRPALSDEWIREDKETVNRVLAVTSSVSNQIFGDFYFAEQMTRVMPLYSIPGLIDHF